MTKQIIVKFDAPDNLRRALSRYRYDKKDGIVTKKAVKDWATQLIEQASLDLQLQFSKGQNLNRRILAEVVERENDGK